MNEICRVPREQESENLGYGAFGLRGKIKFAVQSDVGDAARGGGRWNVKSAAFIGVGGAGVTGKYPIELHGYAPASCASRAAINYDAFLWRCALPDDLASTLAWSEVDMSDVKVAVPRMPDLPPAPVVVPTAPQPTPDAIVTGTPAPPACPAQPRIEPQRIAIEILSWREGERSFARTVRELSIPLDHRLTHGEFCAAGSRKATPIRVVRISESAPPRYVALWSTWPASATRLPWRRPCERAVRWSCSRAGAGLRLREAPETTLNWSGDSGLSHYIAP